MAGQTREYVMIISEDHQRLCFPGSRWDDLNALYPFTVLRSARNMSPDEWAAMCGEAEIIAGMWGIPPLPRGADADGLPRYVCYMCGAVGGFINEEHLAKGVRVTNWGDSIAHTIAESALMGILACLRRVGYYHEIAHHEGGWRPPALAGVESASLFGRRVGLLGFGQIARKLVPLLRPFRVEVFAYDPYVPDDVFSSLGVTRVRCLEELFRRCAIVSNHAANVDELAGAVNESLLDLLPDDGVFVNTARGRTVNEADLVAQHEAGRLWSCLDVFDPEPPAPNHPLRRQARCIITPHQAGPTRDSYHLMGERCLLNLRNWKEGKPLVGEITPEMLRRMT
ncbi:MAG: hydroxyacid dehydrogenase [Armatimonadota bacterium]